MIIRRQVDDPIEGVSSTIYEDTDTHYTYRRLVGGMAWPGKRPGAAVVLGEEAHQAPELDARRVRLLWEGEYGDLTRMFQAVLLTRSTWEAHRWYGDPTEMGMMALWRDLNKGLDRSLYPALATQTQWPASFSFYMHLIVKSLHPTRQILDIHTSSALKGYMEAVQASELTTLGLDDFPALSALGFALEGIVMRRMSIRTAKKGQRFQPLDKMTGW